MAQQGFDLGAQLAERAMIFDDLEQGIVAKAPRPGGRGQDAAVAIVLGLGRICPSGSASVT